MDVHFIRKTDVPIHLNALEGFIAADEMHPHSTVSFKKNNNTKKHTTYR